VYVINQQRVAVKNAAKPEQVAQAQERETRGREREINDIAWVLSTPNGRRFLWRYLEMCGLYRTSFTGSSETFYLEGMRNIGLKLLADITETSPEQYLLMMKEAKERENKNV
jgi:hypothetical protein